MALYRILGTAKYHVPAQASDETVAQAVVDMRRWKREHDNDAEIGSAYNAPVARGANEGEAVTFYLHVNDVGASGITAGLTRAMTTLHERLKALGREPGDAYEIEVSAVLQKERSRA